MTLVGIMNRVSTSHVCAPLHSTEEGQQYGAIPPDQAGRCCQKAQNLRSVYPPQSQEGKQDGPWISVNEQLHPAPMGISIETQGRSQLHTPRVLSPHLLKTHWMRKPEVLPL